MLWKEKTAEPGNPYWTGRLSTVDLLVLTRLDVLILILQTLYNSFKTRYSNAEVKCTEPSLSVSIPWRNQSASIEIKTKNNFSLEKDLYDCFSNGRNYRLKFERILFQETLTVREGSVQLTSLRELVWINCFWNWKHYLLSYRTSYPNEEVDCTEPSRSVSIPCLFIQGRRELEQK